MAQLAARYEVHSALIQAWKEAHRRSCLWRDRGVWERLLDIVIDDPDFEWLMLDARYIKVCSHRTRARGGNEALARTKGG